MRITRLTKKGTLYQTTCIKKPTAKILEMMDRVADAGMEKLREDKNGNI